MDGKRFIDGLRGLLAVADASFRLVFHFANAIEPSDRDPDLRERITRVADEIQQLSGLLHRMALLATGLERDVTERWFGEPMLPVSLPSRLIACHQTLAKLEKSLQRRDAGAELKKKENGHCDPFLELRWPFTRAWTLDLIQELEGHKTAVADAVGSIGPGHSLENLWKEFMEKNDYRGRSAEMYRLTRYHGLKEPNDFEAANFFTRGFDYYASFEKHLKARNPGSRFLFLDGEEFDKWTTTGGTRLWIMGAAGTGKTVLAASLVDEVMRIGRRDVGVAFHFIEFSDLRTHEPQAVLGSLVVQIAARNEEARGMLEKYQKELQPEKGKAGRRPTAERLKDLVVTMAGLFHHLLIVVDGVDEAGDAVEAVAKVLASLAGEKLNIAMVSRDEERIREIVRDDFKRVEVHTPREEIRLFTAGELQKRLSSGKLFLPDPRGVDEAVRKISSHPNTTFLQASANIEFFCVLETPTQRKNFLDDLPIPLDDTYRRFLYRFNRAPPASKALIQATLQLASITDGPLGSIEFCQALCVSGIPGLDPDSLAHPEVDESEFMTLCGFFLNKADGGNRVSLANVSVKEFLEGIDPSDPELAGYRLSKTSANRTLGLCALRFLSLEHFSRLPARSNSEEAFIVKRDARYPFYRYAALCWPYLSESLWDDPEFVEQATALCGPIQTPSFKAWCLEVCRFYQFHGSYNAREDSRYTFWADCLDSDSSVGSCSESTAMTSPSSAGASSSSSEASWMRRKREIYEPTTWPHFYEWRDKWAEKEPKRGWYKGQTRRLAHFIRRGDFTALHMAALLGLEHVCRTLLDGGANVNQPSRIGTPLQCALGGPFLIAAYGFSPGRGSRLGPPFNNKPSCKTVALLLDRGADCNRALPSQYTWTSMGALALKSSEWAGDYQIFGNIVKGGAQMHDGDVEIFRAQCRKWTKYKSEPAAADVTKILELLTELVAENKGEASAYVKAFQKVVTETADINTKLPCSVAVTDDMLIEKMWKAIETDSLDSLKENVHNSQGEDLLQDDNTLKRLLDFATSCSSVSCLDYILTSHVEPDNNDGRADERKAAMLLTCTNDRLEDVAICLIKHGARTTARDDFGDTIWHLVADDSDALRVLAALFAHAPVAEREAALCVTNKNGRTPLAEALDSSTLKSTEMIIANCQKSHEVLQSTKPPLNSLLAELESADVLKKLHEAGLLPPSTGETPLHCLDASSKVDTVKALLEIYPYQSHESPLESYLKATRLCAFDDDVLGALISAELAQPPDDNRTSIWAFVCVRLQDMCQNPTHESTRRITDLIKILIDAKVLAAHETSTGTSALMEIECLLDPATIKPETEVQPYFVSLFEDLFVLTFDATVHPGHLKASGMDVRVLKWAVRCDSVFLVDRLLRLETEVDKREGQMSALDAACAQLCQPNTHRIFDKLLEKADKTSIDRLALTPSGESFAPLHMLGLLGCFDDVPWRIPSIAFATAAGSHPCNSGTHETPSAPPPPPMPPPGYVRLEKTGGFSRFRTPVPNGKLRLVQRLLELGADPNVRSEPGKRVPMSMHILARRLDTARMILRRGGGKSLHVADENGWTPVSWACLYGWTDFLSEMASAGSTEPLWDFKVKVGIFKLSLRMMSYEGLSALHLAAMASADTVKFLLDEGHAKDVNARSSDGNGSTPLYFATLLGQSDCIRLLVARGADIDAPTSRFLLTPLHVAVCYQIENATEVLLELGARHLLTKDGKTPLDLALSGRNKRIKDMVQKSVRESRGERPGGIPRNPSSAHLTPLRRAVEQAILRGDHETCTMLLDDGCPVDVMMRSCRVCSGLLYSLGRRWVSPANRQKVIQLFIDRGASFRGIACKAHSGAYFSYRLDDWTDSDSDSYDSSATSSSSDEIVDGVTPPPPSSEPPVRWPFRGFTALDLLLMDAGLEERFDGWLRAVSRGDLLWLLENSAAAYVAIAHGSSHGSRRSLGVLFAYLAELDAASNLGLAKRLANQAVSTSIDGVTLPLHTAANEEKLDMVQLLISHGADVNGIVPRRGTALHVAAKCDSAPITELLLDKGASFNVRNERSFTPLQLAAVENSISAMRVLVTRGARTADNADSNASLWVDTVEGVVLLLQAGVDLNQPGDFGIPLWANALPNQAIATFVLNSDHAARLGFGAAAPTRGLRWRSWRQDELFGPRVSIYRSLRLFYRRFGVEFMRELAEHGGGEGRRGEFGLMCSSAHHGHVDEVREMLRIGLDPEFEGCVAGTALMAAAHEGRFEVVKMLVFHGAKTCYRKGDRWVSAVEAAGEFPDIVRWLLVGRFAEQGKLEEPRDGWDEETETRDWSGVMPGVFMLEGKFQRAWNHSMLTRLASIDKARRVFRGKVVVSELEMFWTGGGPRQLDTCTA